LLHCICRLMALNGGSTMSALRRLTGVKRKCCERHQFDAPDPFQTSAARDCCDAQCGISYSGVVGCNSRGERSTCGRRRASTLGFTRPSQPSWENVGCADDPTSLRAMRCSASRPMGQSRRTNTPDEFAGWARFTSAATPLPRRRQATRTRAVSALHVRE
jgi:hypothetical protein